MCNRWQIGAPIVHLFVIDHTSIWHLFVKFSQYLPKIVDPTHHLTHIAHLLCVCVCVCVCVHVGGGGHQGQVWRWLWSLDGENVCDIVNERNVCGKDCLLTFRNLELRLGFDVLVETWWHLVIVWWTTVSVDNKIIDHVLDAWTSSTGCCFRHARSCWLGSLASLS